MSGNVEDAQRELVEERKARHDAEALLAQKERELSEVRARAEQAQAALGTRLRELTGARDQAQQQRAAPYPPSLVAIHDHSRFRAHVPGRPGGRWRIVRRIGVQPSTSCFGAPCANVAMLGASAQLW